MPGSRGHRRHGGGRERGRGAGRVPREAQHRVARAGREQPVLGCPHKAAAEAGRRLGFTFKAVSGNNNPSDQASVMKQLVDQGVDVIMLNAIDPKAMAPALAYAKQKGVKVLNLYGVEPKATASVTFDEIRSGQVDAKYAAMLLKKRYGSLKGKVAVLMGIIGQPASDLRAKGFVDYMKKNGVDVVSQQPTGWQADKASAAMQDWLVKYPDLALVYALSDTLAVPAVTVTDRANRTCTVKKDWTSNSSCVAFVWLDALRAVQLVLRLPFCTWSAKMPSTPRRTPRRRSWTSSPPDRAGPVRRGRSTVTAGTARVSESAYTSARSGYLTSQSCIAAEALSACQPVGCLRYDVDAVLLHVVDEALGTQIARGLAEIPIRPRPCP